MSNATRSRGTVLALGALLALTLTSCGQQVNTNVDHSAVLKEARTNFANDFIAKMLKESNGTTTGNLSLAANAGASGSLKLDGTLTAQSAESADKKDTQASVDLTLKGDADVVSLGGKVNANLGLGIKYLNKTIYLQLKDASATSDNANLKAMADQYLGIAKQYTGTWFKFNPEELAAASGASSAKVSTMDVEQVKKVIGLLKDYEPFTIMEALPPENGMYVYKIKPNSEELVKLMKAVMMQADSTQTMTEQQAQELKSAFDALANPGITHKLYIDAQTKKYKKLMSEGTVKAEKTGSDVTIKSQLSSEKDMNYAWTLSVKGTSTDSKSPVELSLDLKSNDGEGSFKASLKGEATPGMPLTVDLTATSKFKAETVKVEAPAQSTDIMQLLGGAAGAGTSMGTNANSNAAPATTDAAKTTTTTTTTTTDEE